MNTDVLNLIDSLINFCQSVLQIPIKLYTWGLDICPWVIDWIEYFNAEYGVDIMNIIPELEKIIEQLEMIG